MKKIILPALFSMLILGCSSPKQYMDYRHEKPLGIFKGRIYVFKPAFVGSAVKTYIYSNGELVGSTGAGGFLCWDVNKGKNIIANRQFKSKTNYPGKPNGEDIIDVLIKGGETYYFNLVPGGDKFIFVRISPEKGERLLSKRKNPKIKAY